MKDISEWYTPKRCMDSEVAALLNRPFRKHLAFVIPRMEHYDVKSILEFGCGAGHFAAGLPDGMRYDGVDDNEWMVKKTASRIQDRRLFYAAIEVGDIRNFRAHAAKASTYALVCAWFFLKHFSLDEWDAIVAKMLSYGRYAAFNVQVADHDYDNGTEYHHVYVTRQRLEVAVQRGLHKIVDTEVLEDAFWGQDLAVWTERVV